MGTRHLIAVVKDNEYKVAQYGQWDGYIESAGRSILEFLKIDFNKILFEKQLSKISYATNDEIKDMWTEAGADPNSNMVSMDVSNKFKQLYPENSRDTSAKILQIIQNTDKPLKLENNIDFAKDSVFCEYGYVIDLDKNVFEVYMGFNKTPLAKEERFYSDEHNEEEYYPIKLLAKFDFNNLPSVEEFLKLEPDEEDEEE